MLIIFFIVVTAILVSSDLIDKADIPKNRQAYITIGLQKAYDITHTAVRLLDTTTLFIKTFT